MNFKKLIGLSLAPILICLLLSCIRTESPAGLPIQTLSIRLADGTSRQLRVELARSEEERALGLMYRTVLDEGRGMLFVFEREQILNFWMKNTLLPLSIAFIAGDGRIVDIQDMEPKSLETVRSKLPARFALEVPRGWFLREGISVGDFLVIQSLPSK